MASILATIGSLTLGAAITGFSFAGGALAFQKVEQKIEKSIKDSNKTSKIGNERAVRDDHKPFSKTRFLNKLERKNNTRALLKELDKY